MCIIYKMNLCEGSGYCFQQCGCTCYEDDDFEIPSEICICGHRNHVHYIGGNSESNIYCKRDCTYNCELIECHNFKLCGQKRPQCLLDCHNGMCTDCGIMFGKIKFINEKDDCPICMENKDMILISCEKHKVCIDCWKKISETQDENENYPLKCPLCRESIWKWKEKTIISSFHFNFE
jgi:hypothetical protein